jgi:hypothetical protein
LKAHLLLHGEKSLRTNEAGPTDLAAFTIAVIQRDGESIPVCAARDLTQNQIRAWKIGDHQCRPLLSAIGSRERNGNNFAGYRFDHAASSSGEFQSRPRTDSLSSAPLNPLFSSESVELTSLSLCSGVLIKRYLISTTKDTEHTKNFVALDFVISVVKIN